MTKPPSLNPREREMLDALERAYTALNQARRTRVPSLNCDTYDIAAEIGQLLVKVTKA
jgi:hypothetical protein